MASTTLKPLALTALTALAALTTETDGDAPRPSPLLHPHHPPWGLVIRRRRTHRSPKGVDRCGGRPGSSIQGDERPRRTSRLCASSIASGLGLGLGLGLELELE